MPAANDPGISLHTILVGAGVPVEVGAPAQRAASIVIPNTFPAAGVVGLPPDIVEQIIF